MGLIGGLVLIALGVALVLLGIPRRGEDLRPFLRPSLAFAVYPAVCLLFLAMGMAVVVTNLL
jgi:hypothetical protein